MSKKGQHAHLRSGRWITEKRRFAIYARDGMACLYCGDDVSAAIGTSGCALDHVVASGGNHESNLVTVCKSCNDRKGGSSVESFCDQKALARIRAAIAAPIDESAGAEAHSKWKSRSTSELPPLPLLNFTQAHTLLGLTSRDFSARVKSGSIPKTEVGGFEIPVIVRAALRHGAELGEDVVSHSEAQRILTVKRGEQIDLEMQVTRKDRIPLDTIRDVNERAHSNVAGMLKAHAGKLLTEGAIQDMLTELREIGEAIT